MKALSREDNGPYNIFTETEIAVEFFDVDAMQVVWHGNYIKYFEIGRRNFLQNIGYYYDVMQKTDYLFPVIEISVKYINPLRFVDRAKIKTILLEYENRLKLKYEIRNAETGVLTTKGTSTQMVFDAKSGETCFICPAVFTDKIESILRK